MPISTRLIDDLVHDLPHAMCVIRRSPGFTAVAVLSLAFGIGANTTSLTGRSADQGAGRGHVLPWKQIVVGQVALSLVLLVAAGPLVRTLRNLTTGDLGFDRDHLLLVWTLPGQTSGRGAAAAEFWHTVQERISAIPGVVSASAGAVLLMVALTAVAGLLPALRAARVDPMVALRIRRHGRSRAS